MSWIAKLYETYEVVSNIDELSKSLEPYFHKKERNYSAQKSFVL